MTTQAAQVHSYEAVINVYYRNDPYPAQGAEILKLSYRIFHICNGRVGGTILTTSSNAPLWHNPHLSEIYKNPDGICWAQYGIIYAHQLFQYGTLRSFKDLQIEYKLPNTLFFCYLQLLHAVAAQFGLREVGLSPSRMEKLLFEKGNFKLISKYCFTLLTSSSPRMERVAAQWKVDIPSLIEESWSEVMESLLPSVISARDKLIQFNYLHLIYYTPNVFIKWDGRTHRSAHTAGVQWETISIWSGSDFL